MAGSSKGGLPSLVINHGLGIPRKGYKTPDLFSRLLQRLKINGLRQIDAYQAIEDVFAPRAVFDVKFFRDGQIIVASSEDGNVRIYDPDIFGLPVSQSGRPHVAACNGCTEIDFNTFGSFSDDGAVRLWDLRKMNDSFHQVAIPHWIKSLHVLPDRRTAVIQDTHDFGGHLYMADLGLNTAPGTGQERADEIHPNVNLARTQYQPDINRLYLSTTRTTLFAVDDFDPKRFSEDLEFFLDVYLKESQNFVKNSKKDKELMDMVARTPCTPTRNRMSMVHYVPLRETDPIVTGQAISVSPKDNFVAVRYNRCIYENLEGRVLAEPQSTCISVFYPIMSQRISAEMIEEYQEFRFRERKQEAFSRGPRGFFSPIQSSDEVQRALEKALLARNTSSQRLAMLFSEWNDEPSDTIEPQFYKRAAYYKLCQEYEPNIIKDVCFSPCGRLLLSPDACGVQILGHDDWVGDFTPKGADTGAKELTVLVNAKFTKDASNDACLTAKFSPCGERVACGTIEGRVVLMSTEREQC